MQDFFPTDVSVRVDGDMIAAKQLVGAAKELLFKALLLNDANGGLPVQINKKIGEDDYVSVLIIGEAKIVNIVTLRKVAPPKQDVGFTFKGVESAPGIYVLCGIARGPEFVTVNTDTFLRDFRPTASTALSHQLPDQYHNNLRLGVSGADFYTVKSSMYSGTMKRVVQAVQGLGKIKDASGYYLTAPDAVERDVRVLYESGANATHGIYKAGTKNHWLVEISAVRGILAMPLPVIPSTRGPGYLRRMEKIGDVGGAALCREFGGLPSGETFPTGAALTAAIADGKVLRLMEADDLSGYYGAPAGTASIHWSGWAFSESGAKAHNTKFLFRREAGAAKTSVYGQHWAIELSLSTHDITPPPSTPVGSGSASITRLSEGKIARRGMKSFWAGQPYLTPVLGGAISSTMIEDIIEPEYYSGFNSKTLQPMNGIAIQDPFDGWGCAVHVFFDGERPIVTNWVPPFCWGYWFSRSERGVSSSNAEEDQNRGPWWTYTSAYGMVASPSGFVSSFADLRTTIADVRTSGDGSIYNSYDSAGTSYIHSQFGYYDDDDVYHLDDFYGGGPATSSPVQFVATPTNMDLPIGGLDEFGRGSVILEWQYYYVKSSWLHQKESTPSSLGAGGGSGFEGVCRIFAMVPAFCREGIVLARTLLSRNGPDSSQADAIAYVSGIGVVTVEVDKKYKNSGINYDKPSDPYWDLLGMPNPKYKMWFSATVNAGPNKAYVWTSRIAYQDERAGKLSLEPPYTRYGLLEGSGELTSVKTTFIGSY